MIKDFSWMSRWPLSLSLNVSEYLIFSVTPAAGKKGENGFWDDEKMCKRCQIFLFIIPLWTVTPDLPIFAHRERLIAVIVVKLRLFTKYPECKILRTKSGTKRWWCKQTHNSLLQTMRLQTHLHTLLDRKTQILNHRLSGAFVPALFVTHPLPAGKSEEHNKTKTSNTSDCRHILN